MKTASIREKVVEEVNLIPEEKMPQILDLIRHFRIGLEFSRKKSHKNRNFAGSWKDMSDEMYDEFVNEINQRRRSAFSRRQERETHIG